MAKVSVFGGGAWGRALCFAFGEKNQAGIISRRNLDCTYQISLQEAQDSDFFVVAICSSALEEWLKDCPIPQDSKVLVASKGVAKGLFVSEIFEKFYPKATLSFLAGPSFAKEVAQSLPCALNVHSNKLENAQEWLGLFPSFIKPYANCDVMGGEIGGAYKNVIAIASGICEGMGLGNNARASLVARGLVEMTRFGNSRNFRVGLGLAQNKALDEILESLGEVAEGVETSKEIYALAQKNDIYTPIAKEVALIMGGKNPKESLLDLMKRMG